MRCVVLFDVNFFIYMSLLKSWIRSVVAALLLLAINSGQAAPLTFTISGDYSASWIMELQPRPDDYVDGVAFVIYNVMGNFSGASSGVVDVLFFNSDVGGGIQINDFNNGGNDLLLSYSAQLYSGPEATPAFLIGSYGLEAYSGTILAATLTTSVVSEPTVFWLMTLGLGLAGLGFLRKSRISPSVNS